MGSIEIRAIGCFQNEIRDGETVNHIRYFLFVATGIGLFWPMTVSVANL